MKLMLVSGTINNQCFLFTLINKLSYFNVTRLPLFTPISLTNKITFNNNVRLKLFNVSKWQIYFNCIT